MKPTKNLTEEQYRNIYTAWNQIEKTLTNFNELDDEDLIYVKGAIINRLTIALNSLDKYIVEEE